MKAWLVTWEWCGDHAKRDDKVAAIFNPRFSAERVRELVEFIHLSAMYTLGEQAACAQNKKRNPYPADFGATQYGVTWTGEIFCGHNPYLYARLVDDLAVEDEGEGKGKVLWNERPKPASWFAPPTLPTTSQLIEDLESQTYDWRSRRSAPGWRIPSNIDRAGRAGSGARRFLEFFTVNIRNPNTRAAYARAAAVFLRWCEGQGIARLQDVQPVHVAAYIEQLGREMSPPSVKQHLACIRMLFDWLVTGQVMPSNPAHSVRGPRHSVSKGVTPVLSSEEATALLAGMDVSTVVGLRDRAIIAVMTYTFARVGAVVALNVEDYYPQKKRWWLRLREKNGKVNEMPCHHKLEAYLDAYIEAAGIAGRPQGAAVPRRDRQNQETRAGRDVAHRCLVHGAPPCCRRRHRNRDRLPHLPRHRHHGLPDERRAHRGRAAHGRTLERENHRPL